MKKTKIHLIGGIFSTIASIGFIVYVALFASAIGTKYHNVGTNVMPQVGSLAIATLFGYILLAIGGLGSFVSGIIQVVNSGTNPRKNIALTAGILNILGGVFFVGAVLSFIAHKEQN